MDIKIEKVFCAYDKERECNEQCTAYKYNDNYGENRITCLRGKFEIQNKNKKDDKM
jgi:hypothetical protein